VSQQSVTYIPVSQNVGLLPFFQLWLKNLIARTKQVSLMLQKETVQSSYTENFGNKCRVKIIIALSIQ
jgi:hypothetical protein